MKNLYKNLKVFFIHSFEVAPFLSVIYIIFSFASVGLPFYLTKIQSEIIDQIVTSVSTHALAYAAIFSLIVTYGIVTFVSGTSDTVRNLLSSVTTYKIQTFYEFKILRKFLSLDMGRYDDPDFKALLQKGVDSGNSWSLYRLGAIFTTNLLPALLQFLIATAIILAFDWRIAIIIVLGEAPSIINRVFFDKKEYSIWAGKENETQQRYYDLRSHVRGRVPRAEIKLYQIEDYFLGKLRYLYESTNEAIQKMERRKMYINIPLEIISAFCYGFAFYLTIQHTIAGLITVGYMTFIFTSIFSAGRSVSNMLSFSADIAEGNLYASHVREFLETEPLLLTHTPTDIDLKSAPYIRFDHVTFSYPGQNDEVKDPILRDVNLTLVPGQKIGLIGDNGAGKSTLVKLLARVYDPTSGNIFIKNADGIEVNLRNIPPEIWQKHVALLFQDYADYNLLVKESIAISDNPDKPEMDRVLDASKRAQSHGFIEKYEHKYDAQIGTDFKGVKFSGGQSQKMALARTLYRKAPLVILDEPTAAVDTESEIGIFKALEELGENTTAIFISHDMATIGRANRIIVLENGTVSEDGSHAELIKHEGGKYKRMYEEQVKAITR